MFVAGGLVVNAWEFLGRSPVERKELKAFPKQVGTWEQTGGDEQFDNETMAVLRASDYLLRNYRGADGRRDEFLCWLLRQPARRRHLSQSFELFAGCRLGHEANRAKSRYRPKGQSPFRCQPYLIQNGDHKELLVYWYQGRGRSVASEYWGKIYTVVDSVRLRRSDGAMVRITTPVGVPNAEALKQPVDLAAQVSTILPEFIPD